MPSFYVWPDGSIQSTPPWAQAEMGPPRPADEVLRARGAFGGESAQAARAAAMEADLAARNAPYQPGQPQAAPQSRGFFSMPEARSGVRAAAPGLAKIPEYVARGASVVGSGVARASPALGPIVEIAREGPVIVNPESSAGDRAAAVGRGTGRLSAATAAGGLGMAAGGPMLAVPAAIGGYFGADQLIQRGVEPVSRWFQAMNPAGFSPEALALANQGEPSGGAFAAERAPTQPVRPVDAANASPQPYPYLSDADKAAIYGPKPQQQVLVPATQPRQPQQQVMPALAPPETAAQHGGGAQTQAAQILERLSSRSDALFDQFQQESRRIDRAVEDYNRQSGAMIPRNLSAMDKFGILAKALGAAAVVAAFPGLGILAGLGAGAIVGAKGLERARGALSEDAQKRRAELAAQMQMDIGRSKDRMGALTDIMKFTGEAANEAAGTAESARQFDTSEQRLRNQQRLDAAKAASQGLVPFRREDGTIVYVMPRPGLELGKGETPEMVRYGGRQEQYVSDDIMRAATARVAAMEVGADGKPRSFSEIYNEMASAYGLPVIAGAAAPLDKVSPDLRQRIAQFVQP